MARRLLGRERHEEFIAFLDDLSRQYQEFSDIIERARPELSELADHFTAIDLSAAPLWAAFLEEPLRITSQTGMRHES